MTTNPFFPHQFSNVEQLLQQDLMDESIQIFGIDCAYLLRKTDGERLDELYDEAPRAYFDTAVVLEMYLKNWEGFQGEGTFLSQMGLEIRDQVVFTVSTRRFTEVIGTPYGLLRPREGDIIYYPINKRPYQITFVEKYPVLYPLGALPVWEIRTELFEAQSTRFNTGNTEIDSIETRTTHDLLRQSITDENNTAIQISVGDDFWMNDDYDSANNDGLDDSTVIQQEADEIIDFSNVNILIANNHF